LILKTKSKEPNAIFKHFIELVNFHISESKISTVAAITKTTKKKKENGERNLTKF